MNPFRLGIFLSHPVEHFAPFFRRLAQEPELDIRVYYYSTQGVDPSFDDEFGVQYQWDIPLLEGYPHQVLPVWSGRISPRRSHWSINPGVWQAVHKEQFDAVLFYGWRMLSNWIGFLACTEHGTPILLIGDTTIERQRPFWFRWAKRSVLNWLFSRISAFLVTSPRNREIYRRYNVSEDRMFFVPLSPDVDRFQREAEKTSLNRAAVRARYGVPSDLPLIIYSGKLVQNKRPVDLLEAFCRLQNAGVKAGLVLVGAGDEREALERYVSKHHLRHVYFLGFCNQSEMPALYSMSDIFALPSKRDQSPLSVLEAMACGLPCVVSEGVGRWGENDAVRPGKTGYVFPVGNVRELTDQLHRLLTDRDLRRRMSESSLAVVRHWSYDTGAKGILEALQSIHAREVVK